MSLTGDRPVAIITGASGGIGMALVHAFLARGYGVVVVVKDQASRKKMGMQADADTGDIAFEYADLSVPGEIEALGETLRAKYPAITWLIHCAGFLDATSTHTPEMYERYFNVNTIAPMRLSLQLRENIVESGGVIFISSTAGLWGSAAVPLYAASKSALHGFAFSLQGILGEDRNSIVICPGPTDTPMREAFAHDAVQHQKPAQVADIIVDQIIGSATLDIRPQKIFVIRKGKLEKVAIEVSTP